ncbi:MAG: hypothetical protein JW819_13490, partial [Candidatus Krumholzibacteriota bacterium]|nr:hypothetical protein [Candidatus Krumholzibacteriota bacterium]
TGFSNTHVNALVNDNMLPFIVSVACVNGNFASTTCFAEAWLRASHNGEPTGAVGMYASTVNQSWAPPMSAQDEVVDLLVAEEKRTFGGLCFNGSCQMIDDYGYSGYDEYLYWTVFGDPSLRVRTDSPAALAVSHEGFVDPSQESYVVETAPGALVGLSHDGQFLGSAFADAGGTATIFLGDLPPAGTQITLTATGFNRLTVVEPVEVGTALVPTCDVNPSSFSELLLIGNTLQRNLTIANNGEEGSVLNYTVEMINMDGGMATEPGWLDLNRLTGSVPEGETDGLILTFDASGTRPGTYHAELHFVSNAPETIVVPVTLIIVVDPTDVSETPAALVLGQNWPNPFNPKTTIHFGLPAAGHARLAVFDAGGRLLRVLLDEQLPAGGNQVTWDGRDGAGSALPSGVYFYRLDAGGERLTRSMLLLK